MCAHRNADFLPTLGNILKDPKTSKSTSSDKWIWREHKVENKEKEKERGIPTLVAAT